MATSNTTARILALAVLLLSVAPLASFYFLFTSVGTNNGLHYYTSSSSSMVTFFHNSNRDNASLEEIWMALFQQPWMYPAAAAGAEPQAHVYFFTPFHLHHPWASIIIPWGFTLLLGVILPAILSLVSLFQRRQRATRRQRDPLWSGKGRQLNRILQALCDYSKILEKEDLDIPTQGAVTKSDDPRDDNDEDGDILIWKLPEPGHALADCNEKGQSKEERMPPATRTVVGVCAICLHSYKLDEKVVWSSNEHCVHTFHENCILSWLMRKRKQKQCPCCRQVFVQVKKQ